MANTDENYRGKPDWVRRQRNSWHGVDGMYNLRIKFDDFYRDYCRTLMALDDSVGAVMDELKSKNLLNDTLFIYMGDNGFQFGEHGLIDKRTMYEPSMRVPMIAHCPDLFPAGKKVEQMVLNLDIGPTLLEAAGAPIPSTVHGKSFLPLLTGKPTSWRTEFVYEYFWERDFPQTPTVIGLRTDQYSFMQYHGLWDLDELYDVRKDPQQRNNLLGDVRTTTESGRLFGRIKDPEKKKLVADLQKRTKAILDATGGLAGTDMESKVVTPLPKKLGIKPGAKVRAYGAPDYLESLIGQPLSDRDADLLLIFATTEAEMELRFGRGLRSASDKTRIWIFWPKKRPESGPTSMKRRSASMGSAWAGSTSKCVPSTRLGRVTYLLQKNSRSFYAPASCTWEESS